MISEEKKKIVIENYFKSECNINTTLHDAYVKGFERGLSKAPQSERKTGRWIPIIDKNGQHYICEFCGEWRYHTQQKYCGECGRKLKMEAKHETNGC